MQYNLFLSCISRCLKTLLSLARNSRMCFFSHSVFPTNFAHVGCKDGRTPHSFCLLQLFDLVYREETLLNVIKSVTRNGRSIVLTAVLALILVYLFSIVGYIFFKDDFILEVDRVPNTTLSEDTFISLIFLSLSRLQDC